MIFTGLRLSLQASWTTLVAAELVGALAGLGRVLNVAQQDIYPAMVMVGMAAVGVLGWATTRVLAVVESRAMPWIDRSAHEASAAMIGAASTAVASAKCWLLGAARPLRFFALWWGAVASGLVARQFLPTPLDVASASPIC